MNLQLPIVIGCSDPRGHHGSAFTVYVDSPSDLLANPPSLVLLLAFAGVRVPVALARTAPPQNTSPSSSSSRYFALTAQIPHLPDRFINQRIPVLLLVEDPRSGHELASIPVESYALLSSPLPHFLPHPRRQSYDLQPSYATYSPFPQQFDSYSPLSLQQQQQQQQQNPFAPPPRDYLRYSPPPPPPPPSSAYSPARSSASSGSSSLYQQPPPPPPPPPPQQQQQHYAESLPSISSSIYYSGIPPPPQSSQLYLQQSKPQPSSQPQQTPQHSLTGDYGDDSGSAMLPLPILVRTSTLPNYVSSAPSSASSPLAQHVSPADHQPSSSSAMRASLRIHTDLEALTHNWTADEWKSQRRLVKFSYTQHGSVIRVTAAPLSQQEYISSVPSVSGNSLSQRRGQGECVISCLHWARKKEYYVTSVDTIALLEQLVSSHFTVEEKNRIRRNLEGYRPLTVSKGKAECEHFFKLIMGFPSPKPRNIEKDVKVFPWKVLGPALKKIVGKYVCSFTTRCSLFFCVELF
ncbi:hypothetical protein BZA70DRAFT_75101 [Myxozyma melibiosi]|uniref:DUF7082 domain-containing protein n=1 Tax=Myxozyma melibiosi TaxID=54550 RepID=A0ABR1F0C7_9ASCO